MQHRDLVGDVLDEFHVVLDHDDRLALRDAIEQFGRQLALARAHAGNGLVQQQQLRPLHQQHADFQPLLLAVAEPAGLLVEVIAQEDEIRQGFDLLDHSLAAAKKDRLQHALPVGHRDFEVLEDGQIFIHRRRLELAPHPSAYDLVLGELGQVFPLEPHLAGRRAGLAADHVQQRGLPRPVGADDHSQLARINLQTQLIDGAKAIERHRKRIHSQDGGNIGRDTLHAAWHRR